MAPTRSLKHWGWGYADEQPSAADQRAAAEGIAAHLGFGSLELEQPVPIEQVELPSPRLRPPSALEPITAADDHARASHALGKAYRDVVRGLRGQFDHPPDLVCRPRDQGEVEAVLEWAEGARAALIPFGGGTSVVGGVEPRLGGDHEGAVSLDLTALDQVLEVDGESRAARIQAGARGPALEDQLQEHGLTLRFYPQSFQFSTLGGWIATRAGGHFATLETHIDDLVESVRAITPMGEWRSRRLPASGAGPSPDRLLLGSEGTLGVILDAWVRVRPRPSQRASAAVRFDSFSAGAVAARALAQGPLHPTNCRLIDPDEARLTGAGDGEHALLVVGFESAEEPVESALERALAVCAGLGGEAERREQDGAVSSWRQAFLRAPYLRDTMVAMGILAETFETAITWERLDGFVSQVRGVAGEALREACGAGTVTCRLTHLYPDGAAPYFTVMAPARQGEELGQWEAVKQAASEAIMAAGGTITHHHAVGRDHRPWYDRQRPEPFAAALRAAKAAVDPGATLNPGVLIDPQRRVS